MATFEYQALTPAGRLMKGAVEADSRDEAERTLREMQLTVNSVEKAPPPKPRTPIGRSEFILFNQQLAAIARAGIPLERALRELSSDITSRRMQGLIHGIADDLEAGSSIEQAFAKRRRHFPPLYGRIVEAGVQTGRLAEMLTSLNRHLETARQTRRIFFEALCYPTVVLALAVALITTFCVVVVPGFEGIFSDLARPLPLVTRAVLWLAHNLLLLGAGVAAFIGAVVVAYIALSSFPEGRRFRESAFLSLPVLGRTYRSTILARMADAMATLAGAGCDLPTCLRLSAGAAGSENLKKEAEMLAAHIEQGNEAPTVPLRGCRVLPGFFLYSVRVGAQRNELQDHLHVVTDMYTQQARGEQARMQAVLMPAMVVFVGGIIGFGIVAMFAPLLAMIQALGTF